MNLKPLIGGIVAGVAGALVWGGITYATKMEVGWIAWGVGFCVGVAVRYLAGGAEHAGLGVMAAGIAIGSVVLGKFLAVHWLVANVMNTGAPRQVDMVLNYAFVVAGEREAQKKPMRWPPGKGMHNAESRQDFPKDVLAEAEKKWNAMPPAEQETERTAALKNMDELIGNLGQAIRDEAFKSSFSPWDLLWLFLAVSTAYKIATGTYETAS